MPNKKIVLGSALLAVLFVLSSISRYAYSNILPYQYTNQWEPTESNINITGEYDAKD